MSQHRRILVKSRTLDGMLKFCRDKGFRVLDWSLYRSGEWDVKIMAQAQA